MALLFDTWEIINGIRGNRVKLVEEKIANIYSNWGKIRELEDKYQIKSFLLLNFFESPYRGVNPGWYRKKRRKKFLNLS